MQITEFTATLFVIIISCMLIICCKIRGNRQKDTKVRRSQEEGKRKKDVKFVRDVVFSDDDLSEKGGAA